MEPPQSEGRLTTADGRLVTRSCEVDDVSFRAFLAAQPTPRVGWTTPDGLELVAGGAAVTLQASGAGRFDELRAVADRVLDDADAEGPPATRPRFVGGLSFDEDHEATSPWDGFPAALFVLPRTQLTRADGRTWLTVREFGPDADGERAKRQLEETRAAVESMPMMVPSGARPGVVATRFVSGETAFRENVERAVERIRDGALRKVVLATALDVDLETPVDVADTLERLRRTYPECFRFLVQPDDRAAFFGPPPERLVKKTGLAVETEALAGSVERGDTPEADAALAASLLESEKLQHEQGLVVDAIRDQLAPLGEVTVGEQGIRRLTNIQHLRTPIRATLAEPTHVLDLVAALHPTPAVGGLPPDVAGDVIRETEQFDRGWYAAPVGWFDAAGDGEFAVAIRSAVTGGLRARLYAGNGIVADSDPTEEWAEIQPKFRPVLDELAHE